MVSRNVRPAAIMQTPRRKAQNEAICVAGMNQKPPTATMSKPAMMPPLYPSRVASHPGRQRHEKVAEVMRELHPG